MHRLEAIADIRQGARHDGRHRIGNVTLAQRLGELGILDMTRQIHAHSRLSVLGGIKRRLAVLSSALLALTAACSPYRPVLHEEESLARDGFVAHPADTTARWQMMNLLPPDTLTYRMKDGRPVLLYADPIACGCVYMGDATAYRAWKENIAAGTKKGKAPQLPDEQRMTAEINQHPGWDWSVWDWTADPDVVQGIRQGAGPGPNQSRY